MKNKIKENYKKIVEKIKEVSHHTLSKIRQIDTKPFFDLLHEKYFYLNVALLFAIIIIAGIYVYVAKHSVYSSDDFSHFTNIRLMQGYKKDDSFNNGIIYALWHCKVWGGVYFGMFLQGFMGINEKTQNLESLRQVMAANAFIYFVSIAAFVYSFVYNIVLPTYKKIEKFTVATVICFVFVFLFHGFNFYDEPWTWFPAATSYSVGLALFFISFAIVMSIKYDNTKNSQKINIIKSVICVPIIICAMGASVAVVMIVYMFVFAYFIYIVYCKKINIINTLLLLLYIVFGAVNILMPGNMSRRKMIDTNVNIEEILNITIGYIKERLDYISGRYLMVIMIIMFSAFAAYFIYKYIRLNKIHMIISTFMLLAPFAVAAPIAFGYSNVYTLFNREHFVIDIMIIINFINLVILLCGVIIYLFENLLNEKKEIVYITTFSIMILTALMGIKNIDKIDIKNMDIAIVIKDIVIDRYKIFDEEYDEAFRVLCENKGKDVVKVKFPSMQNKPTFLLYYPEMQMYNVFFENKKIENINK